MHKSNPSQRDAYTDSENLRQIGLDAAVKFHAANLEHNYGEYNKSRHISRSAHLAKDWMSSLFSNIPHIQLSSEEEKLAELFISSDIECEIEYVSQIASLSKFLATAVYSLSQLTSLFAALEGVIESIWVKWHIPLARRLAETLNIRFGSAFAKLTDAYSLAVYCNDPSPLLMLAVNDSALKAEIDEAWKEIKDYVALSHCTYKAIESLRRICRHYLIRLQLQQMRERSLLEKAPTDEKPLTTIVSNPHDFSMGCLSEKPPPKANKISPRFVSPSILTPSAPPSFPVR